MNQINCSEVRNKVWIGRNNENVVNLLVNLWNVNSFCISIKEWTLPAAVARKVACVILIAVNS